MAKPNHQQTFQAGMAQDIDAHLQPANTYRDADNGRLLYNPDEGEVTMGHGLAFVNAPGNRLAVSLPAGMVEIGSADCSRGTLLFSTNGTDAEIGLWAWDQEDTPGSYETLYTDRYDPNLTNVTNRLRQAGQSGQDRLGWRLTDSLDIVVELESETTERVYWTDRRHTVHTLDLIDAYAPSGVSWHRLSAADLNGATFYPKHWSVHAFRERSDLVFPRIKFAGRGKGRLLAGAVQVAVQYLHQNGHESVWSMLTRRVFVTTKPLDDERADQQTALRSNHHNRVMAPSGQMSGESQFYELEGIDLRWQSLRIAVVYFVSPDKPFKRVVGKPIPIGSQTSMTVEITQLDGDELTESALNQRYDNVLEVGTLTSYDNRLISGNLRYLPPIQMDGQAVRFTPKLRGIDADQTDEPKFRNRVNPISKRNDNDPITNSQVTDRGLQLSAFAGQTVSYAVRQDYAHYKGQLYDQLLRGHFRGETYEYGALVLDRSGQAMFVQPLPAFTFPEQYAPGPNGESDYYSLTKLNPANGRYELQIMGVTLSGLALPVELLYDADGRLNVSGFMIVRRKRNARIKHQGVVVPVCRTEGCYDKDRPAYKLFPLPTLVNSFARKGAGDRFASAIQSLCSTDPAGPIAGPTSTEPGFLVYHSPDVLIEETLEPPKPGDLLQHTGIVGSGSGAGWTDMAGQHTHLYSKSYKTTTTAPRFNQLVEEGRPSPGDTTRIGLAKQHIGGFDETYKEFDKDNLKLLFETQAHPFYIKRFDPTRYRIQLANSLLQRNAVLMKVLDWKSVDIAEADATSAVDGSYYSYRLASYLQATTALSPEKEPYFSTGHYQPITQAILDLAHQKHDASGALSHYVFDEVEVWGGDCYVNLFDFTRLYPFWSEGCERLNPVEFGDYAVSHLVPIESKYNLALRWGRSFAANATKPQATSCDGVDPQFNNGITAQQPEDWKYNAVLNLEEAVQFYAAKDPEVEIIIHRPNGFQWSPEKSAGQRLDAWRIRYAGDYGAADGVQGPITKLATGSFSNLYVWQTNGIGAAPLNASQYANSDAGVIIVNSGRVFNGMVYLSREAGTQHPESVWVSKGQMGGWDARNGVLLRHSQAGLDELSKQENVHDLVQKLTAGLGASDLNTLRQWRAVSGIDTNGDVLTSFWHGQAHQKTLVYSPVVGAFVGSLSCPAVRYGKRGRYLFAVNPTAPHQLFVHHGAKRGTFFGITYPTRIRFIINPVPTQSKRFDNGFVNVNRAGAESIAQIRQWTPNGGAAQDHTIFRDDERIDWIDNALVYPMHELDWEDRKEPLRDHYAIVELLIDNAADRPVELLSFGCSLIGA